MVMRHSDTAVGTPTDAGRTLDDSHHRNIMPEVKGLYAYALRWLALDSKIHDQLSRIDAA